MTAWPKAVVNGWHPVAAVRELKRKPLARMLMDKPIVVFKGADGPAVLVERCPDVSFVLDHCGKPAIRDDAYDAWARALERLASHDRVSCKISGLLTESREDQRSADVLARWIEPVRACFGARRLLYGSDWPVCALAGGAGRWRAIVDAVTASWPHPDRQALFADTALRIYGISVPVHG